MFFFKELFFALMIMMVYIYIFLFQYVSDFKGNEVYYPSKNATEIIVNNKTELTTALCNNETDICYGNGAYDFYYYSRNNDTVLS